jgi:hypothetical protein
VALAFVRIVRHGRYRCSNAIESKSFSFEAGGRPTQPRCPNHESPSLPIATERGRFPIKVVMSRIHAGWVATGVVSGRADARFAGTAIAMNAVRRQQAIRRARAIARWYRRIDFAQPVEEDGCEDDRTNTGPRADGTRTKPVP